MYKFADKYKVKHILTGGNYSTECARNPIEWMYYQSDSTQIKYIHRQFGKRSLKNFPLTNKLWHKIYQPYAKGIKLYRPLDYMPYHKKKATQFLVDNLGYQRYAQKHFESRFTRFYESYWLLEKFGFDTRKVQYSSLILTGQMSRDEALERLKSPAYDPVTIDEDFNYIANKLDITPDELRACFDGDNKSYRLGLFGVYRVLYFDQKGVVLHFTIGEIFNIFTNTVEVSTDQFSALSLLKTLMFEVLSGIGVAVIKRCFSSAMVYSYVSPD